MTQSPDDDLALVDAARAGDQDAYEGLFNKYRDRAAAIAFRYTHNREDALDVVQEAFIKAFGSLDSFRGEAKFSNWLFRIVTNKAIDMFRRRKEPHASYDETREGEGIMVADTRPYANPVRNVETQEMREAYEGAVAQLSPDHRAVFALHVSKGLRYGEIAEALGIPIGTVMSRLHYARKRLRDLLRDFMVGAG